MSLLLDARKKIELAMEQTGVHKAIEPQLSETLRLEDTPAAGGRDVRDSPHATTQRAAPAGGTPTGIPLLRSDPRAAGQNLFAAKAAPSRTEGRLGIIPIALISGAVIAAGGGYYVWREISPPPVMQRQAPMPPPAQPIANIVPPVPVPARIAPAPENLPAAPESRPIANVLPPPARLAPLPENLPAVAAERRTIANKVPAASSRTPSPALARDTSSSPSIHPLQNDEAAGGKFLSAHPVQPIRIEHGQQLGDTVDPALLAAWQAYRNGDLRTAWQLYGNILKKEGKNRDALLGMAAIAQHQSQDDTAAHYYRQVLALDPRDPIAHAGMSALPGASYAEGAESRLKLLLAQQPQSAALHFALGNLYAEQSRWGDAQQSYFSACNLEPDHAQFAFNLAVSLDHLGKSKLAAQYYRQALQLDNAGNASSGTGFDHAQTQQRLNDLTAP